MVPPADPANIRLASIVRGVLAMLCGLGATIAGLALDQWPIALGLFVAAVFIAPTAWINGDGGSWGSAGPS